MFCSSDHLPLSAIFPISHGFAGRGIWPRGRLKSLGMITAVWAKSSGVFEEMTFDHWTEDVQLLAGWLSSRSPRLPLLLHGLEVGAILAGKCFDQGMGDGLLMWSPPGSANQPLRTGLLQWASVKQLLESPENRTSAAKYIQQLLQKGALIDVQGYQWSASLWRASIDFKLPSSLEDESSASVACKRPVSIVKLGKNASPLGPTLPGIS